MYGILLDSERQAAILAMAIQYAGSVLAVGQDDPQSVSIGAALSTMALNFPEDVKVMDAKSVELLEEIHGVQEGGGINMVTLIQKWGIDVVILPGSVEGDEEYEEEEELEPWQMPPDDS